MIKIEAITDTQANVLISGGEDVIRLEIRAFLNTVTKPILFEIFYEELDKILEEREQDVQNSFSDSDREQDH